MPSIKFQLNRTYGLGGDVVWRISRWPPWQPSWIAEWNDFSNSESLCHRDAFHQVLAQSDLWFGNRCRLTNFKMQFWIFVSLWCHCDGSIRLTVWEEMSFEEFQDGRHGGPSWISERNHFSNFQSPCHCDASHQASPQSDLRFGRRCRSKYFKMATAAAILDIRTERF